MTASQTTYPFDVTLSLTYIIFIYLTFIKIFRSLYAMRIKKYKLNRETYLGSLEPYFRLIKNEYRLEMDRKHSIETRGNIVITLILALTAFIFQKVEVAYILILLPLPLTFLLLVKIITGFLIYFSLICSSVFGFKTIFTALYATFELSAISEQSLGNRKNKELVNIITTYRDIISENRKINDKKAKTFEYSIIFIIICLVSTFIFLNI